MSTKKHKASVLIVSLIILGVALVTALSISLVTIRERRASINSSKSGLAYQNAETGVEKVMYEILNGSSITLSDVCANAAGSNYSIDQFSDKNSNIIKCSDSAASTTDKSVAVSFKITGQDADNQNTRAIEAAVAAGGLDWHTVGDDGGASNFGSCWKSPNPNDTPAQYAKDSRTGVVYVRGVVCWKCGDGSGNASGSTIFTMPSGYKPGQVQKFLSSIVLTNQGSVFKAVQVGQSSGNGIVVYSDYNDHHGSMNTNAPSCDATGGQLFLSMNFSAD